MFLWLCGHGHDASFVLLDCTSKATKAMAEFTKDVDDTVDVDDADVDAADVDDAEEKDAKL